MRRKEKNELCDIRIKYWKIILISQIQNRQAISDPTYFSKSEYGMPLKTELQWRTPGNKRKENTVGDVQREQSVWESLNSSQRSAEHHTEIKCWKIILRSQIQNREVSLAIFYCLRLEPECYHAENDEEKQTLKSDEYAHGIDIMTMVSVYVCGCVLIPDSFSAAYDKCTELIDWQLNLNIVI